MNSDTAKNFILNAIFFVLGIGVTYIFYIKTKIDGLEVQVDKLKDDVKDKSEEIIDLTKVSERHIYELREAQNEIETKAEKISLLQSDIDEKKDEIDELNDEIKEKDKEIKKNIEDLKKIVEGGDVGMINKKYQELYGKLTQLNIDKEKLRLKNEVLTEERNKLKLEIIELEGEIKGFENVTIPELEEKLEKAEIEVEEAKKFKEFINVRGDIRNISINKKENIMFFDIIFDQNEVDYLEKKSGLSTFTFIPTIINETDNNIQFIPKNHTKFVFTRSQLTQSISIAYPVYNYSFDDYHNGKKGVNMEKDHLIDIKVTLKELHHMEVANKSFYMK